jgi:uroporphyrinogen decarboxylase
MMKLTSRERIERILKRQPVDRVGLQESFWGDTQKHWVEQGHLKEGENLVSHFGLDIHTAGWLNSEADLDHKEEIVEETEEWKLARNGNGALLKWWKNKSGTPEHVDFLVKDRAGWEEHIRPRLLDESRLRNRVDIEGYRKIRRQAAEEQRFFCWAGCSVFEQMHPTCGHEYMLMGMALDPDWVRDMCEVYADMTLKVQQILFAEVGPPDGIFYYEDMGFKQKPFMSPKMYKDIVWPAHKKQFDYAHSLGCPVIVHSCGFVEPLVPGLIEAGMNCLQAIEVKAGMDLIELKKKYGDRIALFGGMDIRTLESTDLRQVEAELQKKLPVAMAGSGYILHTDHSVSTRVEYETLKYFQRRGLEIGTY